MRVYKYIYIYIYIYVILFKQETIIMATNMGIYGTSIKALFVLTPSGSR